MIDHNIDVQSVFSWAPKVVRKCESKHWFSCGADGRRSVGRSVYSHVITKFSGIGRFTKVWGSTHAHAWSFAIILRRQILIGQSFLKPLKRIEDKKLSKGGICLYSALPANLYGQLVRRTLTS